jgi:hypothetical protein
MRRSFLVCAAGALCRFLPWRDEHLGGGCTFTVNKEENMFDRNFTVGLTSGILAFCMTLSSQAMAAFTAQEAAELKAEANTNPVEVQG